MAAFVARYAQAFLEVITAEKLDATAVGSQLNDFLATWNGSPELREFFVNPAIPALQKVSFLDTLNKKLRLRKELRNLLAVLIDNDRIGHVVEVAAAYRKLLQEQLGDSPGGDCDGAGVERRRARGTGGRSGQTGRGEIDASFKLDAAILGGTVVRIGSTVYDGSVRGRLDRLKEVLVAG